MYSNPTQYLPAEISGHTVMNNYCKTERLDVIEAHCNGADKG